MMKFVKDAKMDWFVCEEFASVCEYLFVVVQNMFRFLMTQNEECGSYVHIANFACF